MSIIAENIKKYREAKGLTQKQLADAIGKTKNVVSNWENDLNKPDADTIELLLGIFEVDANTFLGWNNPDQVKADAEELADKIISNDKIKNILPLIANLSSDDLDLVTNFILRLTDKTK
jgi:transcriptional regulator with XRE-family HTH domain